ncbi:MAG: hypothetical protein ABL962_08100 [Fimbriimonadaceae bacterium]
MARIPRMETEDGKRLYRVYVIERTKQIAGYSFMALGLVTPILVSPFLAHGITRPLLFGCLATFALGSLIHYSRKATKEAATYRVEPKRRFPPPPIESNLSGARPNEVTTGEYTVRFDETSVEEVPSNRGD